VLLLSLVATASRTAAQSLPAGPLRALDGRLTVSGEIVATAGERDYTAFFNYTDYEHNTLRLMRLGLSGLWRPTHWLALVGEVRSEDLGEIRPYAAYVRVRPWRGHAFDIQAGRIPPSFGAFGRRAYGSGNPVIGYPLAYQYLTSLRPDAIPGTANDLLRMRARGWRPSFPIGASTTAPGVPLVSTFRWDTGVQLRWARGPIEMTAAVTSGTLSNPRVSDDNDGKQISGRVAVTPASGLILGASAARGAWLSRDVAPDTFRQDALGADAEYSRGHWLVRGEMVWSRWALPLGLPPSGERSVSALAAWAEGRYRLTPRIFIAARADRLGFSRIVGGAGGQAGNSARAAPIPWDAPVERLEATAGYYLQRNLVARLSAQANWRAAGRVRDRKYYAAQLGYWF